ncbi:type III PLP-dependent enzyme [Fodinicurvata sp. EGI_FJ10296]|uniref:type III PLP-dependent enzyme n=1 Tax=Fodinicurvata sp. EGI_FJ10296 TaxID=3231908 RepID=UPI0034549513
MTQTFSTPKAMVEELRPEVPIHCLRPHVIRETARRFVQAFPGNAMYAVKCNNDRRVLRALYEGGVRHFDTASIAEIEQIHDQFLNPNCYYMHPVKSRTAIRESYHRYGMRTFSLDHHDELRKLREELGDLSQTTLVVRLEAVRAQAVCDLGGKFGAPNDLAADLLREVVRLGAKPGLTFHVGSQCLSPKAYLNMMRRAADVWQQSGVDLAVLDIGGGFPVAYVGTFPPDLSEYMAAIAEGVQEIALPPTTRLMAEPGRAMVAKGYSIVVRVMLRRDNQLYLNDGSYGSLMDMKLDGIDLPIRILRPGGEATGDLISYDLFGPTCDSVDHLPGPYWLPDDIIEGDWLEIGQAGAYTNVLHTGFNGFGDFASVFTEDEGFEPTLEMLPKTLRGKLVHNDADR